MRCDSIVMFVSGNQWSPVEQYHTRSDHWAGWWDRLEVIEPSPHLPPPLLLVGSRPTTLNTQLRTTQSQHRLSVWLPETPGMRPEVRPVLSWPSDAPSLVFVVSNVINRREGGREGGRGVMSARLTACTGRIQDGDCDVSISVRSIYNVYLFNVIQSHGCIGPGSSVEEAWVTNPHLSPRSFLLTLSRHSRAVLFIIMSGGHFPCCSFTVSQPQSVWNNSQCVGLTSS